MFTVGAVYTADAIVGVISDIFKDELPDCRLINVVDSGLIPDIIRDGGVTVGTARRLLHCCMAAQDAGVDVILNTCSSVGEVADHAQCFIATPILKIDAPMARQAVASSARIGVLATLPSTLTPTMNLVRREAARAGKEVTIVDGLAEGAFEALTGGSPEQHDRILTETAVRVAPKVDTIVLAQGSMARMADTLAKETGRTVLSSPRSGVIAVREYLERLPGVGA
ncbi:MAG: Asp/Glu/hydantoin racemase [Chitinivibrionales bacterium]|nr:Asp/Glu/hydantoin racemase [Chitinivibrionales bacterium]